MPNSLGFQPSGLAVVVGSSGGIGRALLEALEAKEGFARVIGLGRSGPIPIDIVDESSIAQAAGVIAEQGFDLRLVIDATGFLHGRGFTPEKSWAGLDPAHMQHAFAVNAMGPALLMKHLLPLLPRTGRSVFATLSARVGSIGDNALGGWYSYRASKAALNQFVRTASVELRRKRPDAVCVALHPGTVDTGLSQPFGKTGLDVQTAGLAAERILDVVERLTPEQSGGFFDHHGTAIPW